MNYIALKEARMGNEPMNVIGAIFALGVGSRAIYLGLFKANELSDLRKPGSPLWGPPIAFKIGFIAMGSFFIMAALVDIGLWVRKYKQGGGRCLRRSLCAVSNQIGGMTNMTPTVERLLMDFDHLPDWDKKEMATEVLRRAISFEYPALSDCELVQIAEEIFLDLEREENAG